MDNKGASGFLSKLWREDKAAAAFYALSVVGIIVCVLTELERVFPAIETLCGGPNSGCSAVKKTSFSSMFGVSLGIWGLASYVFWMILFRVSRPLAGLYGGILLGAEIYFVYLQFFVIQAICNLCMAQFAVVALINALLFFAAYPARRGMAWRAGFVALAAVSFAAFYMPAKAQAQKEVAAFESITSWGDPKSPYRMEVFSDYECTHCKHFEPTVEKIMKDYPEIYVVFRDFIIQGHKLSPLATAYAGSVAYYQGREMYMKTRTELFDKQEQLKGLLSMRLPMMKEDKVMEAAVDAKIKADRERAEDLKVQGTPTSALVKNGETIKVFSGAVTYEQMKPDLDKLVGRAPK
jgi:protein-disulfide isomerase/uncharacterized membrane protein